MPKTTGTFSQIARLAEFQRDLKKLRRFKSLEEDLTSFTNTALMAFHHLGINNLSMVRLTNLGFDNPQVYKARKFACKSLKGRGAASGIRIIYAYYPENNSILFIEIYFKADKEQEDRERILRVCGVK